MERNVDWLFEHPIAHRGAAIGDMPENSLLAFQEAVDRNMPIELDVYVTRDNHIVVFHDFDTLRMTGAPGFVSTRTLAQLKKLCLKGGGNQKIPTLKEVLDLVQGKVGLMIELKVVLAYKRLCNTLFKELEGYQGNIAIHGFSQRAISYVAEKTNYPRGLVGMDYVRSGFLGIYGHWLNSVKYYEKMQPDFLNYNFKHVPSVTTEKFKKDGKRMMLWTVKTDEDFVLAQQRGDNAVCNARYLSKELTTKNFEKIEK